MTASADGRCRFCGESRTLLTINAAAALVSVNRKTIYRWIRAGALEYCVLPSGSMRVFADSLVRAPGSQPVHEHSEARETVRSSWPAWKAPAAAAPSGPPPPRPRPIPRAS